LATGSILGGRNIDRPMSGRVGKAGILSGQHKQTHHRRVGFGLEVAHLGGAPPFFTVTEDRAFECPFVTNVGVGAFGFLVRIRSVHAYPHAIVASSHWPTRLHHWPGIVDYITRHSAILGSCCFSCNTIARCVLSNVTMVRPATVVRETWNLYTPLERRNIFIYIAGIMMYKFGLEAFNGSVIALATNRYDELEKRTHISITFQRVGVLTGLNQAFQCVGSILIAPLIKRYPTKNVLACAVLIFGFMSSILLILDAATGGKFRPHNHPHNSFSYYGNYNTDGMIPICKFRIESDRRQRCILCHCLVESVRPGFTQCYQALN
jgi:hypothetical protein